MIVLVCFNSFFVILDFLDLCVSVYSLRKYQENRQNMIGFWQNLDILYIRRQFCNDPNMEEKDVVGGGCKNREISESIKMCSNNSKLS